MEDGKQKWRWPGEASHNRERLQDGTCSPLDGEFNGISFRGSKGFSGLN